MVQDLLHVRDEKAANTDGGTSSGGVNTRVLGTAVVEDISGASLASDQITLPIGDYEIEAYAPCWRGNMHRAYLHNVTDASEELIGGQNYAQSAGGAEFEQQTMSLVRGRFSVVSSAKDFEIRHQITAGLATVGLGRKVNDTRIEIYTDVWIRKIVDDFDLLHVRDEKSPNVAGGTSSGGENVRVLNTVKINEISGASLSANQITLLAGTYQIEANAPAFDSDIHKLTWRNVTLGDITTCIGLPVFSDQGISIQDMCYLYEQFIIHDTADFELVHHIQTAESGNGLGRPINDGRQEIYADVMIRKLI